MSTNSLDQSATTNSVGVAYTRGSSNQTSCTGYLNSTCEVVYFPGGNCTSTSPPPLSRLFLRLETDSSFLRRPLDGQPLCLETDVGAPYFRFSVLEAVFIKGCLRSWSCA